MTCHQVTHPTPARYHCCRDSGMVKGCLVVSRRRRGIYRFRFSRVSKWLTTTLNESADRVQRWRLLWSGPATVDSNVKVNLHLWMTAAVARVSRPAWLLPVAQRDTFDSRRCGLGLCQHHVERWIRKRVTGIARIRPNKCWSLTAVRWWNHNRKIPTKSSPSIYLQPSWDVHVRGRVFFI